jgi:hypothetical protein
MGDRGDRRDGAIETMEKTEAVEETDMRPGGVSTATKSEYAE